MDTPLATEARPKDHIVLIIDKDNQFGSTLGTKIHMHATVVLASEKKPQTEALIHIPYTKKVPEIPVGTYSHLFLFSENQTEHELLLPLAEKANKDNAKFVYILPYWLYSPEVTERLASLCRQWVLVLVGDVFDTLDEASHIGQILHQAKSHKSIALPDLGLETLRPVASLDVVDSLLRIGFGLGRDHVCFIFSKHSFTALSIVHALQRIDPLLRIDFANRQSSYPNPLLPEGVFLLETEYPALKKIQEAYQRVEITKGNGREKLPLIVSKKTKGKRSWSIYVGSSLFGILFFLLLPLLWTLCSAGLGSIVLDAAKTNLEKGQFAKTQTYSQASDALFGWAQQGSDVVAWESSVVGQKNAVMSLKAQLHAFEELSQVVTSIAQAGENFGEVASGKTITPQATFTAGTIALKSALLTLQSMTFVPKNIQGELIPLKPLITLIAQTIDITPALFGLDAPKTYLLIIQNNAELRPGGGVLVAYAVIKVEKGRIGNIVIHTITDADRQLKGHVEPPFALRRYMLQEHWYLKDSNFSADNLKNAQTEAFFLQQELGVKVDGVITMDMDAIKRLLGLVGSVHAGNEPVTTANISDFFVMNEATNAAQQKQGQFLTELWTGVAKELQMGKVAYPVVGKYIVDTFLEKHLMLAFPDVTVQQVFTINNMSSALWDPRKSNTNTLNDFMGISEANLGQNPLNSSVTRSITQDLTLNASGTVSGILTIHYTNKNKTGETYKNYLRVLLPAGAQLSNISFNAISQSRFPAVIDPKVYEAKGFKSAQGVEIEHTQEGGKEVYGLFVLIPSQVTRDVAISYTLSQKLDLAQTTNTIDELLFKQPGTNTDSYTFTLTYPNFLTLANGPKPLKKSANKISITQPLATDLDYQFTFSNQ